MSTVLPALSALAAGGVRALAGLLVIRQFLAQMPARHFHMSGKKVLDSAMTWRNPRVNMGLPGISEFEIYRTDGDVIREAREILDRAWRKNG